MTESKKEVFFLRTYKESCSKSFSSIVENNSKKKSPIKMSIIYSIK